MGEIERKSTWIQGTPWWVVHFTVNKGTYSEFENTSEIQAETYDEAMEKAKKEHPNSYVWAVYRK